MWKVNKCEAMADCCILCPGLARIRKNVRIICAFVQLHRAVVVVYVMKIVGGQPEHMMHLERLPTSTQTITYCTYYYVRYVRMLRICFRLAHNEFFKNSIKFIAMAFWSHCVVVCCGRYIVHPAGGAGVTIIIRMPLAAPYHSSASTTRRQPANIFRPRKLSFILILSRKTSPQCMRHCQSVCVCVCAIQSDKIVAKLDKNTTRSIRNTGARLIWF